MRKLVAGKLHGIYVTDVVWQLNVRMRSLR
jgi:hypothetical protein